MEDLLSSELINPQLAGKAIRYLAITIDYVIYFSFYWLIVSSFGHIYTTNDGITHYDANGLPALACFSFWFFMPIVEGLGGQSFGKLICKIQVVKSDYGKVTVGKCIVRHLFDLVDFFPFL